MDSERRTRNIPLARFLRDPLLRQSFILTSGRIFALGISALTTILIAHALPLDEFGRYTFSIALIGWVGLLFSFGLDSAPKMLANDNDFEHQRRIVGAFFTIGLMASLALTLALVLVSFFLDRVFNVQAGEIIRFVAPLAGGTLIPLIVEWACYGLKRPIVLTIVLTGTRLMNLLAVILLIHFDQATPDLLCVSFLFTAFASAGLAAGALQPSFERLFSSLNEVYRDIKDFGAHAYLGRVPAVLAFNLDRLVLGHATDSRTVGLYSFAQSITAPASYPGNSMAQVLYRDLAKSDHIARRYILLVATVALLSVATVAAVGIFIVTQFLYDKYAASLPLIAILSVSTLFQALYPIYNTYLSAKGMGVEMRKLGWYATAYNTLLCILVIPAFGATGAAIVACIVNACWLLLTRHYCQKSIADRTT